MEFLYAVLRVRREGAAERVHVKHVRMSSRRAEHIESTLGWSAARRTCFLCSVHSAGFVLL